VRAVVVTCGIRSVWEKVLEREGLLATVKVIGGPSPKDYPQMQRRKGFVLYADNLPIRL
jgi:hypothetical protein